ncbi:Hypothetical predicted protein [Mytilus galloprovincialis]|uniref:C2H2-type domain-containing protein n=1 Tax=Mytilus galloprovincialis TaxID=29158 RepID=A0A8B6EJ83_MYTGA|nr:Hypothetical predicted protein [Mytilus galloprovincialis]
MNPQHLHDLDALGVSAINYDSDTSIHGNVSSSNVTEGPEENMNTTVSDELDVPVDSLDMTASPSSSIVLENIVDGNVTFLGMEVNITDQSNDVNNNICTKVKCSGCDKYFASKSNMKRHSKIHTGQMSRCTIYFKEYQTKHDLIKINRHKKYQTKHDLNRHNESVHKGTLYTCDRCPKTLKSTTGLKNNKREADGDFRMISVNTLYFVLFYILTLTTCVTQGGNATLYKILNKALEDAVDKYAPRQYRSKLPLPVSPVVRVRQSGRTPKDRMDIFAGQMEDPAAAFSVAISGLVFADFAKRIRSEIRSIPPVQSSYAICVFISDKDHQYPSTMNQK